MKMVLASGNQGKLTELKTMLAHLNIEVLSLADYPEMPETVEDGHSFESNAQKKAREAAEYTGLLALADDSGLEVDFLNGQPGVHSARFAGEPKDDAANNEKLLQLLKGLPWEKRTARFRCVIAICTPAGEMYTADGSCAGFILEQSRGDGGFGYDPLFYVPQYDKTFAELTMEEKNKISHRGIALKKAVQILERIKEGLIR
ncbi:XTP/dITP diphosphatase [Desulfofalx alkaliphila]|uniref:XTP/dITP diphosphatase n=1 Tax=Desulfofalx alkaliphila TaxID=105483 RepID=UPI0004E18114|nr:XTP/dITP diphosphatase [Desulfofalx alkaliphila]